jgi:hypothetical protein
MELGAMTDFAPMIALIPQRQSQDDHDYYTDDDGEIYDDDDDEHFYR